MAMSSACLPIFRCSTKRRSRFRRSPDRKSTRLNSSHSQISYAVFCLKKKSTYHQQINSPVGNLCHYKWIFPDDDKFLGATSFNKIHHPGNGTGDDDTEQR